MKRNIRLFINPKTEQDWLARQKGWKLVATNGMFYTFEESANNYNYEYIYFAKSSKELPGIISQISDVDIEFVCKSSQWALFRKDAAKGEIHVFADNYTKYKMLIKKYNSFMALGACYMCLGSSQIALSASQNKLFGAAGALFYVCSCLFFLTSSAFKKYSAEYDNGTYAARLKNEGIT